MDPGMNQYTTSGEVLVVDDTAESLAYLCDLLGQHGYAVRAAPNGELALWTASSRRPDLILLDVRMPGMDGLEVCRRLKDNPDTAEIPVIFLSALTGVEDKVQGFLAGGVDYIGKPFSSEEVLQRVAIHVKLAKITRELEFEKSSLEARVRERTAELEATAVALRKEVAAHRIAQEKLRLAASAFEASLSCIFITDATGTIVSINPAFSTVTGYTADECIGKNISLLNSGKHEPEFFRSMWSAVQAEDRWTGEIWNRRKDRNEFPCMLTIATIRGGDGKIVNYVGVFLDLSESKDAQTLIDFLTQHDALTGFPNRILVRDRFNQLAALADAQDRLAVICVNLDRFRLINDAHGYEIGNELLQWVASQLTECVQAENSVFRESSDEFLIVCHENAGKPGISALVDKILSCLNQEIDLDGVRIVVSVSAGVALYPDDGVTFEELVANSSVAMGRAKGQGGECHAFFSEVLDQGIRRHFNIAQHLRYALEREEMTIYYQPQVDERSKRIVSAEALLRWTNPELGAVSPAKFIPIAEKSGRIVEIGIWVMRSVCSQIARWKTEGHGWIKVAVNLSGRQFIRLDTPDTVMKILDESGIPPSCLELEITEGAIIEDVEHAIETMRQLKAIGVHISLDDFGTGYSSLSYLKKFPIDYLKIDQSFVRELSVGEDDAAIVLSIIDLAHHLHLEVIAEGVETPAQRDFLVHNGCHLIQGYLYSKPVPADDFIARCAAQEA